MTTSPPRHRRRRRRSVVRRRSSRSSTSRCASAGSPASTTCRITQRRGEILSIIGPNGAGKTSLFNCLTGVYRPQEGVDHSHDRRGATRQLDRRQALQGEPDRRREDLPDVADVQRDDDVRERPRRRRVQPADRPDRRDAPAPEDARRGARERPAHPAPARVRRPAEPADDLASTLPYGDRRRLEIARALGTEPRGAAPRRARRGHEPRREARARRAHPARSTPSSGVTILLIEHDMKLVMSVAERIVVLNFGRVIAEGTPADDPAEPRRHRRLPRHLARRAAPRDRDGQAPHDDGRRGRGRRLMALLEVDDVEVRYGAVPAVAGPHR